MKFSNRGKGKGSHFDNSVTSRLAIVGSKYSKGRHICLSEHQSLQSTRAFDFKKITQSKIKENVNNQQTEISAFLLISSDSSLRGSILLVFVEDFEFIFDAWCGWFTSTKFNFHSSNFT